MLDYQKKYIENMRSIGAARNVYAGIGRGFVSWYETRLREADTVRSLREENTALLNEYLFPELDNLYGADRTVTDSLSEFASELMDWKTNLDCGLYIVIHDALLSLCRTRRDRTGVIRELYMLGMGLYYQRRSVEGIFPHVEDYRYRNELVFTEAASYMPYFEEIEDSATRGYIIRSLANIAICTSVPRRKIAASRRTLEILTDSHYRDLEPGLPWENFLKGTHQQMSSNRAQLSRGDLTKEDLACVLDSCYEVFRPEEASEDPSIRWLWPYYEMEYSCGYADVKTTLERIEELTLRVIADRYEVSDLYGLVQLPIYYGIILRDNPKYRSDPDRVRWLAEAYRRMEEALLSVPAEEMNDYYYYLIDLVFTDFYEMEGVPTYRELTKKLMIRLSGERYITVLKMTEVASVIASALLEPDGNFFDDIPFIATDTDPKKKAEAVRDFARNCALYADFGLIKMNMDRLTQSRNLFEDEENMYRLHTVSGYADLKARPSTEAFADCALGHHSWYDGSGGYPPEYDRLSSACRQMTDVIAVADALVSPGGIRKNASEIIRASGSRYSPQVASVLSDGEVLERLEEAAGPSDEALYRRMYDSLTGN